MKGIHFSLRESAFFPLAYSSYSPQSTDAGSSSLTQPKSSEEQSQKKGRSEEEEA